MGNKKNLSESSGKDIKEQEQEQQPEKAAKQRASEVSEEEQAVESSEVTARSAEEVAKLIQEKDEYYDRLLRTQADFDNYRKRIQKEQANLLRYGAENALREILPVVDNLERAVDSARKHGEVNSHLEGIELILAQMREAMTRLGVKPIETVGEPFDPNKHDALIRVHAPDAPEGSVVEEIRKGYYLHDKVLRPAQVTVGTHEKVGDS